MVDYIHNIKLSMVDSIHNTQMRPRVAVWRPMSETKRPRRSVSRNFCWNVSLYILCTCAHINNTEKIEADA
jgi:hypothetical protein